jgi:drug/metabolite transporter (DMT)-like permease
VDSVRRPAATTTQARRGWGTKFLLLALIWGLSFLFIKLGEERLAALHVALGRMLTGTATLAVILAVRRERLPSGWRTWGHLVVASLLLNAVPFSLIAYGEQHVSSVVAGIWNATTPLFTLPVAVALIAEERLTRRRAIGLLIGLAGVLTVLGIWRGHGATSIEGNLLCLGSAVSYGFGFPYARRFLASVLTLGALGTGIAYILNYSIIRDAGATVASTVTYIIPIFSTLAGIIFLNERLTWYQPLGAAVILLGAAIAQERLHQCSRGSTRRSPVADATSLEPSLTDR